jgi:RNA 2',3'-cyclic 3'-phosphodiesterase
VASDDRLRLFCALLLPDDVADLLAAWQERHLAGGAPGGARLVPRANLHVTVAFLGSRPADELASIAAALGSAAARAEPPLLEPGRYRETRSVGMLVLRDATGAATAFADDVQERLERLGVYRRERRAWLPHVTVLRFHERPGLAPPLPAGANVCPSDAAVMVSVLRPDGARYEVVEQTAFRREGSTMRQSEGGR